MVDNLITLYDATDENGVELILPVDKNTNDLYFNNKKVLTELELKRTDKFLAYIITLSTAAIAICNIITTFHLIQF